MGMYDDLLAEAQPGGRFEKFEKVDPSIIAKLKSDYSDLPVDYISFLEEIGSGEIGNAAYVIYNGLLTPDEIYDEVTVEALKDLLVFGDDMQGYCSGFDFVHGWSVIEIDPTDMSYNKTFDNFSAFIRDKLNEI